MTSAKTCSLPGLALSQSHVWDNATAAEPLNQIPDEELVYRHRATAGSTESDPYLNELFQRHYKRVAAWCLRFTGERESAADLAQEILCSAFQHLHGFRGQSKFSTWLYAIARNRCINEFRARAARPQETVEPLLSEIPDSVGVDPHTRLERESSAQLVRQMIQEHLDETERAVVAMHYADEMPLDAITRTLGLTNASGAKAYIVSARRKLQAAVRRWNARAESKKDSRYGKQLSYR